MNPAYQFFDGIFFRMMDRGDGYDEIVFPGGNGGFIKIRDAELGFLSERLACQFYRGGTRIYPSHGKSKLLKEFKVLAIATS